MQIYLYTLKKYIKSSSTWVITIFTLLVVILLSGYVAFANFDAPNKKPADYGRLAVGLVAGLTAFLAIFTSVFAGFKSATMFKDEIEDGTFLILLSKPMYRSSIIFFKWLSLQTIIFMYTFLVAGSFALSLVIFDNGNEVAGLGSVFGLDTLASQALTISASMWMILFVSSLIFSSISLLLSTRFSVGATIGISIALGIAIPVTSLISVFAKKPEYYNVSSNWIAGASAFDADPRLKTFASQIPDYENDPYYMYDLAVKTNVKDSYKNLWFLDFRFQFTELAGFAIQSVVPNAVKSIISKGRYRIPGFGNIYKVPAATTPYSKNIEENIRQLDYMIANTWEKTMAARQTIYGLFTTAAALILPNLSKPLISNDTIKNFAKIGIEIKNKTLSAQQVNDFGDQLKLVDDRNHDIETTKNILAALLYLVWDLSNSDDDQINGEMKEWLVAMDWLSNPINLYTSRFMSTYNVPSLDAPLPSRNVTIADRDPIINSVALGIIALRDENMGDYQTYSNMVAMIRAGHTLTRITTKNYVNKETVLYAYLVVAFALLPIVYFAIRHKDFR